jgi:hypothetical protein
MEKQETKVPEAVKTIAEALKADPSLFVAYQSNIAMSVYDAIRKAQRDKRAKSKHGTEHLTTTEIHKACNTGAVNFLHLLMSE